MHPTVGRTRAFVSALLILIGTSACAKTAPVVPLSASVPAASASSVANQASIPPTSLPSPTPGAPLANMVVMTSGYVGQQPRITAATALGKLCPGDEVVTLQSQHVGADQFFFIRVNRRGPDCGGAHVAVGSEGWIKSNLLEVPADSVAEAEPEPTPVVATAEPVDLTSNITPPASDSITANANASRILFIASSWGKDWQVDTMAADGSDRATVTTQPFQLPFIPIIPPAWSPDGTQLMLSTIQDADHPFSLHVVSVDGTQQRVINQGDKGPITPTWSPDGARIAFSQRAGMLDENIYVAASDGTGAIELTNDSNKEWYPAWSPDGTRMVFCSDRDTLPNYFKVYVMNADGSQVTRLTEHDGIDQQPVWSPDGTRIAFVRNQTKSDMNSAIYIVNADGSGLRQLTHGTGNEWYPAWSPDGQQIAFSSNSDGNLVDFDLYVINVDGTGLTQLTNDERSDFAPKWLP